MKRLSYSPNEWLVLLLVLVAVVIGLVCGVCGCSAQTQDLSATGGITTVQAMAAVGAQLDEVNAGLLQVQRSVSAGGDVNSTTVVMIAVGGLALLGLSYPVGKLIWLLSSRVKRGVLPGGKGSCDG